MKLTSIIKRAFAIALIVMLIPVYAFAEDTDSFFEYIEPWVASVCDLSNKEPFTGGATGVTPGEGEIVFDFRESWYTMRFVHAKSCKQFNYFECDELLGVLFQLLNEFDAIQAGMPDGEKLVFKVLMNEKLWIDIDSKNYAKYFAGGISSLNGSASTDDAPTNASNAASTEAADSELPTELAKEPSVFNPSYMADAYNGSISDFFEISGSGDHSKIDEYFKIALQQESNGTVTYTNSDGMIKLTFKARGRNYAANEVTFWTSHEYEYRNIPQFCFAWAIAKNRLDGTNALDFMEWINGADEGAAFTSPKFNAAYSLDPDHYSSFTITEAQD